MDQGAGGLALTLGFDLGRLVVVPGIFVLLAFAYLLSENRRAVNWRTVGWGLALQAVFAFLVLKTDLGSRALTALAAAITRLIQYADEGGNFVFGWLTDVSDPAKFVFAFKVLPIVIFISSLSSCLYYLGILQKVVLGMARVMTRLMGVSGSESLSAAANVFMGQTEAPLVVAPYVPRMTQSELLAMMTGGMATVSGAVLGGYIALGVNPEYLISASIMAAPASLVFAKLLIPETETSDTAGTVRLSIEPAEVNLIDAAARGAARGVKLAINIAAMLIAFVSIIYLVNGCLEWAGGIIGVERFLGRPLTIQIVMGYVLSPVAFLMGVPWTDVTAVGQLIGVKLTLNEFVAYLDLIEIRGEMDPRSELIATYALCGFANLGSIGIQLGGIGGLAPERRSDLARLGLKALLAGSMASFLTASVAGLLS
ncbi:MAG: NupC/NupG family nucleoside CNT transporter [Acidobacteriota bacterium]|nr:MAG: NupC/NupG family nucleoside CNT transporter [Acidobacteriota bacterium]